MKVTSKRQVHVLTGGLVLLAFVVVSVATLLIYPPERWPHELAVGALLSIGVATPICYFMTGQLYRNFQLSEELRRLINRDKLTNVATRDYFFARMSDAPQAFGVSLMVDIDHFKQVNDTYGHFAGDEVIRHVAELLQSTVRADDIVCRFGGEEFVVFLSDHDAESGYLVAERMRTAIAGRAVLFETLEVRVTVSIGGSLKLACDQIEAAIQDADAALYRAKKAGRNRTIFAGADKPTLA